MTLYDDTTGAAMGLMVILGVPCLVLTIPAIIQGIGGDWSTAYYLIDMDIHWVGLLVGLLIILTLTMGALE